MTLFGLPNIPNKLWNVAAKTYPNIGRDVNSILCFVASKKKVMAKSLPQNADAYLMQYLHRLRQPPLNLSICQHYCLILIGSHGNVS